MNTKGKDFIKSYEGFSSTPYRCSAGVPTIGFGSTMYPNGRKVTMQDKAITKDEADKIFEWHLSLFERDVEYLTKSVFLNQNQFNSLVSFAYNLGSDIDADNIAEGLGDSTLLKRVLINPNDPTIANEFAKWNKAGGKVVKGLTTRRLAEAKMYFEK